MAVFIREVSVKHGTSSHFPSNYREVVLFYKERGEMCGACCKDTLPILTCQGDVA